MYLNSRNLETGFSSFQFAIYLIEKGFIEILKYSILFELGTQFKEMWL
jgi:hypothetical protein